MGNIVFGTYALAVGVLVVRLMLRNVQGWKPWAAAIFVFATIAAFISWAFATIAAYFAGC